MLSSSTLATLSRRRPLLLLLLTLLASCHALTSELPRHHCALAVSVPSASSSFCLSSAFLTNFFFFFIKKKKVADCGDCTDCRVMGACRHCVPFELVSGPCEHAAVSLHLVSLFIHSFGCSCVQQMHLDNDKYDYCDVTGLKQPIECLQGNHTFTGFQRLGLSHSLVIVLLFFFFFF